MKPHKIRRRLKVAFTRPRHAFKMAYARSSWSWGGRSYQPFVLVSASRCGSSMVQSLINSNPNSVCLGEVWSRLNSRSINSIADSIWRAWPASIEAVGAKLFYYHPHDDNPTSVIETLRRRNVKILHLQRCPVDSAVSKLLADVTGRFESGQHLGKTRNVKVECEIDRLGLEVSRRVEQRNAFNEQTRDLPTLELRYEEFEKNFHSIGKVFKFLGCSSFASAVPHIAAQKSLDRIAEVFSNHVALKQEITLLKSRHRD